MRLTMKTILIADALVSGAAGLAMGLGAGLLAPLTGLPETLLLGAGVSLAPWTLALLWLARQDAIPRSGVMAVIGVNAAWVLASIVVMIAFAPNVLGYAFVITQAVAVGVFAELQLIALRHEIRTA